MFYYFVYISFFIFIHLISLDYNHSLCYLVFSFTFIERQYYNIYVILQLYNCIKIYYCIIYIYYCIFYITFSIYIISINCNSVML